MSKLVKILNKTLVDVVSNVETKVVEIDYRLKFMAEHKHLVKKVTYNYFKKCWLASQPATGNRSELVARKCNVELLITNQVRTKETISYAYSYDHKNHQVICWMCDSDVVSNICEYTTEGYMFVLSDNEFGRALNFMGTGTEDLEALSSNKFWLAVRKRVINELIQSKFYLSNQKLTLIDLGASLVRGAIESNAPHPDPLKEESKVDEHTTKKELEGNSSELLPNNQTVIKDDDDDLY